MGWINIQRVVYLPLVPVVLLDQLDLVHLLVLVHLVDQLVLGYPVCLTHPGFLVVLLVLALHHFHVVPVIIRMQEVEMKFCSKTVWAKFI